MEHVPIAAHHEHDDYEREFAAEAFHHNIPVTHDVVPVAVHHEHEVVHHEEPVKKDKKDVASFDTHYYPGRSIAAEKQRLEHDLFSADVYHPYHEEEAYYSRNSYQRDYPKHDLLRSHDAEYYNESAHHEAVHQPVVHHEAIHAPVGVEHHLEKFMHALQ